MEKLQQEEYMDYIADKYYQKYYDQGYADAGHNGPHGHKDTPVRNTSHYLVIYSYLYKKTNDEKYRLICEKFADYICKESDKTSNGAVQCMTTDRFDHLNGLIGQGWAIEGLLYYYEISKNEKYLNYASKIFYSQKYDYNIHLWHRIEIDGKDIGIDKTYNHNIWFAACAAKILDFKEDKELEKILDDLLIAGADRDFRIYSNGLLKHSVNFEQVDKEKLSIKEIIKFFLYPLRQYDLKKLDTKYMEKAYHIFDFYGFCILEERFPNYKLFSSQNYSKAKEYASNYKKLNKEYGVQRAIKKNANTFNMYSYSYNSMAFEYPYVSCFLNLDNKEIFNELFEIQKKLMFEEKTKEFTKNNPDINTFNARTYEIIRYLDRKED